MKRWLISGVGFECGFIGFSTGFQQQLVEVANDVGCTFFLCLEWEVEGLLGADDCYLVGVMTETCPTVPE